MGCGGGCGGGRANVSPVARSASRAVAPKTVVYVVRDADGNSVGEPYSTYPLAVAARTGEQVIVAQIAKV